MKSNYSVWTPTTSKGVTVILLKFTRNTFQKSRLSNIVVYGSWMASYLLLRPKTVSTLLCWSFSFLWSVQKCKTLTTVTSEGKPFRVSHYFEARWARLSRQLLFYGKCLSVVQSGVSDAFDCWTWSFFAARVYLCATSITVRDRLAIDGEYSSAGNGGNSSYSRSDVYPGGSLISSKLTKTNEFTYVVRKHERLNLGTW